MSYDVQLIDPVTREVLEIDEPHLLRGGTYCLGGDDRLRFNVTYNYANHLYRVLPDGLRGLYGKTGAESIPIIEAGILQLGDDVDDDYWQPTEGNVKRALCALKALAQLRPDGVWDGD